MNALRLDWCQLVCVAKRAHLGSSAHGNSRLDGKETEIQMLLGKKVSKTLIAKVLDVSRSASLYFISSRQLL